MIKCYGGDSNIIVKLNQGIVSWVDRGLNQLGIVSKTGKFCFVLPTMLQFAPMYQWLQWYINIGELTNCSNQNITEILNRWIYDDWVNKSARRVTCNVLMQRNRVHNVYLLFILSCFHPDNDNTATTHTYRKNKVCVTIIKGAIFVLRYCYWWEILQNQNHTWPSIYTDKTSSDFKT